MTIHSFLSHSIPQAIKSSHPILFLRTFLSLLVTALLRVFLLLLLLLLLLFTHKPKPS